jgi:hypothetical protein
MIVFKERGSIFFTHEFISEILLIPSLLIACIISTINILASIFASSPHGDGLTRQVPNALPLYQAYA